MHSVNWLVGVLPGKSLSGGYMRLISGQSLWLKGVVRSNVLLLVFMAILMTIPLHATRTGGIITEDTVWTLENSPYIIHRYIYVSSGVTLTIEPGVQVLVNGASVQNFNHDFEWTFVDGMRVEPIAKMIVVYGRIIALGTEENPIVFDALETDPYFRWCGIHLDEESQESEFRHCVFRRTNRGFPEADLSTEREGAISIANGYARISHCNFEKNLCGIWFSALSQDMVIYKCKFSSLQNWGFQYSPIFIGSWANIGDEHQIVVAGCEFTGVASRIGVIGPSKLVLFNRFINYINGSPNNQRPDGYGTYSLYGNRVDYSVMDLSCGSYAETDTSYCRRNIIDSPSLGRQSYYSAFRFGEGMNIIADNYGSGFTSIDLGDSNIPRTDIYNNVLDTSILYAIRLYDDIDSSQLYSIRVFNNLLTYTPPDCDDNPLPVLTSEVSPNIFNNSFVNFHYGISGYQSSPKVINNVFANNQVTSSIGHLPNIMPIFMNNCMNVPLEHPEYDFGGNIVADPAFADTLAGDYSLSADSPCIDAGANIPELPEYDLRYHKRVAQGSPGGSMSVDMGAYEYNSVYIGGIRGYIYDAVSGEPVDFAKVEIMGKLPEFSDSLGCFPYPCGAGTKTVRISRWDYQSVTIPNVVVTEGEDTILNIPMLRTNVSVEDATLPGPGAGISLYSYPNPFNPETTISMILPTAGRLSLKVYNLRGQLIQTLAETDLPAGHHSYRWDGRDSAGRAVASGIYLVQAQTSCGTTMHKMMLVK